MIFQWNIYDHSSKNHMPLYIMRKYDFLAGEVPTAVVIMSFSSFTRQRFNGARCPCVSLLYRTLPIMDILSWSVKLFVYTKAYITDVIAKGNRNET